MAAGSVPQRGGKRIETDGNHPGRIDLQHAQRHRRREFTAVVHMGQHRNVARDFQPQLHQRQQQPAADHVVIDQHCVRAAGGIGADTAAEVPEPFAHIRGGRIDTENGSTYLKFQFEAVTADELSPVIRAEGEQKTVLGASFTDEAQKLAAAFGVTLKDAAEVYTLVKESGCMPEALISPPEQKRGFRAKLAFRVRRSAWRGYLFSGAFLLLFSLFTIFPVYYVVSGGVLLAIAAAVRFFGKKD